MLTGRRTVTDHSPVDASEAGIGRAAVKGTIIGFVVVVAIVSGIALAGGAGMVSALEIGAFAALWAGPGWGGMVGAVRYADRMADDERRSQSLREPRSCPQPDPKLPSSPSAGSEPMERSSPAASPSTS